MQTAIANKVVNNISDKIQGEISFEKVHFKPFTTFVLKNVLIVDKNPVRDTITDVQVDTFFRAQYIIAKFTLDELLGHSSPHFDKIYISNAQMNLVLEDDPVPGKRPTDNLSRIFGFEKGRQKKKSDKDIFLIHKVEIQNMGFQMRNHRAQKSPYHDAGINWNDLDVKNLNLNAIDLGFKAGIMSGSVNKLSFREKSGWACNNISGDAKVGNGKTIIRNFKISDKWSDLEFSQFMMSYKNSREFIDFVNRVKLDADIASSTVDFRTLHYFAPKLEKNTINARISGGISGYISDFEVKDLHLAVKEGGFSGKLDGRIKGITDIQTARIDTKLSKFLVTTKGVGDFVSAWMPEGELNLSEYAKGIMFSLNGHVRGPFNNLKTNLSVYSMLGSANANVRISQAISTENPIGFKGSVTTKNLDVGSIIGSNLIRHTTIKSGFDVKFGRTQTVPDIKLDSLIVERLALNGYEYTDIKADGYFNAEAFEGEMISNDPNLTFFVNTRKAQQDSTDIYNYTLTADVARADLNAINIDDRGRSEVTFGATADFAVSEGNKINGLAEIKELVLENEDGIYNIGNITLTSVQDDKKYHIDLLSSFAEATYSGTASPKNFVNDFTGLTLKKELPAIYKDSTYTWSGDTYKMNLLCHNTMDVLAFALPGLYIESGTSIVTEINDKGEFNTNINSGRLAYKKQYLKGLAADFNNLNNNLTGSITCEEIQVSSIKFNESRLGLFAQDDHIGAGFSYNNDTEVENHGQLVVHSTLSRDNLGLNLDVEVAPSSVFINSKEWQVMPSNINILGRAIAVNSFGLVSGDEAITLNGRTSETQNDTLTLGLQRFDISLINSVIPEIGIKGAITGTANLTSAFQRKGVNVEMICDSTYIADTPLGVLNIEGAWDSAKDSLAIMTYNDLAGEKTIQASSRMMLRDRIMETQVDMNKLRISYVKPILKDVFSDMDGYLSGSVMLNGHLDSLNISSVDCRLDEGLLKVGYTNVPYYTDGTFHLDNKGVYFDEMNLRDQYDGTGNIYGSINWDNFRNMNFDTYIKVNEMEGINLTENMGDAFYGNIFATGNIHISGPSKSIVMDIDAVTAKSGQIHIPVNDAATAGRGTNLLKFTEYGKEIYVDPYEAMMYNIQQKEDEAKQADVTVNVRVTASPDVEAFVEIDKASGNVLSGRGNGALDLSVSPEAFTINGDYTLTGGNYKFVAIGLVSRDFEIQDGSSVRFNGDILESTLDINAIYKTKASLSTLIADSTAVANRRTVECGIHISDKISNPRLEFSIEIPDLDPTIKSRVESAMSTDDKIQKQFLSLILSNSFLPDEQSGIVNNSSMLYSNVTEMLANQLSNIFQKLNIPLDLGLNYQPNEKGNDIFDVAVSTQLFNNRVVVNGSVGNKQYNTGGTQDVVGDLDIEIKLDRSGSFRLNMFSHSADSYTNFLDNSQRNGVGLTYQTEFNSFGQFVKGIFSSKAKRQATKQAEEQAIIDGGKVTLDLNGPVKK